MELKLSLAHVNISLVSLFHKSPNKWYNFNYVYNYINNNNLVLKGQISKLFSTGKNKVSGFIILCTCI